MFSFSQNILQSSRIASHSSEIGGLCLMKGQSKMLQNLPYSWNKKPTYSFVCFSFRAALIFFSNECP